MSRTYPNLYRDVTANLKLRKLRPTQSQIREKQNILDASQLRSLILYLKEHEPMLYVMGMLQVFCGLRVLEAAYLRDKDIDFVEKTITVAESDAHKPKTGSSYRTIPVCDSIIEVISNWLDRLKIKHQDNM